MTRKPPFSLTEGLIILFIFLRTLNQVLFKHIALGPGGKSYSTLLFDPLFYLAGFVFLSQAATWLAVLRRMSLSYAYPFTSVTVITLLVSGRVFFNESITLGNVLGAIVIMVGVFLMAVRFKDEK